MARCVGMKRVATTFFGLVAFLVVSPFLGMVPSAALFVFLFLYGLLARPLVPTLVYGGRDDGYDLRCLLSGWLNTSSLPTGYFGI